MDSGFRIDVRNLQKKARKHYYFESSALFDDSLEFTEEEKRR